MSTDSPSEAATPFRIPDKTTLAWGAVLVGWLIILCLVPDPRPLSAPSWAVSAVQGLLGISEPGARIVSSIALRACGSALIGMLLATTLSQLPFQRAVPTVLLVSPILAIGCLWVNYGYFPIRQQLQIAVVSALAGGLTGLALRRSWIYLAVPAVFVGGVFVWGISTGISNDLYEAARATGNHLLDDMEAIPEGDDGFVYLLESAFTFAADNSHGADAVLPNQAAILALGVILGEEKVAEVARRKIDLSRTPEFSALRKRITLRARHDLARHFWVSAALAVLSDENRSMGVGIAKELMDAYPGGSGFSFVDLTADRAGTLLAEAATGSDTSARQLQSSIRRGVSIEDVMPPIEGLPEGLSRDQFQKIYGGLGGERTDEVVAEIRRRFATCAILRAYQKPGIPVTGHTSNRAYQ